MDIMRHDDGLELRLGKVSLLDQLGGQTQFRTGRA